MPHCSTVPLTLRISFLFTLTDLNLATRVNDVNEAPEICDNGRVYLRARWDTVTATNYDKKRTSMTLDQHLLVTFSRMVGPRVVSHFRAPTIAMLWN